MSWLTNSFEENTIAWLLLSTILGSIAGSAITLFFDDFIRPRIAMRRERKRVYRKYRNPLIGAANSLERQINTIVKSRGQHWLTSPYYRLSTFYKYGAFLFWVRLIEMEVGHLDMDSSKQSKQFNARLYGPFGGICSIRKYFKGQAYAGESALPRDIARAIGEEMLDTETGILQRPVPIGFSSFVRRYGKDPQFRAWFSALDQLLESMAVQPKQIYVERLIVTAAQLKLLVHFLDPKGTFSRRHIANLDLITRKDLIAELTRDGIIS